MEGNTHTEISASPDKKKRLPESLEKMKQLPTIPETALTEEVNEKRSPVK